MRAEFTVKKEEMSWEDVVDDYAKTSEVVEDDEKQQKRYLSIGTQVEGRPRGHAGILTRTEHYPFVFCRIALHKKKTSPSRDSPQTTKKPTKRSSDEAALAAMAKRRKAWWAP